MRRRFTWFAVVAFLALAFIWACSSSDDPPAPVANPLEVQTSDGKLVGTNTDQARAFHGIPFAKPPVGDLRWKAPQDPEPWSGALDATQRKDVCVQAEMDMTWHATGKYIGNEDCLYLDVYRPQTDEQNLPVYVFFHGGSNRFGGAASYDGSYLAQGQNVVVVVAQYRLGPLGWFRHPGLRTGTDNLSDSGNFATLDHIKALEWVQRNIAGFGGSAENVTIGGQSAGASNVGKLLIAPLAAGLFDKAVVQSLGGSITTPAQGDTWGALVATNLGCTTGTDAEKAACLRTKTGVELVASHNSAAVSSGTYSGFSDGTVLPGGYVDTFYSGNYNKVPVMLGSTEYEWKNFMPLYAPYPPPTGYSKPNWSKVYDLFDPNFDPGYEWTYNEIFPTQQDEDLYEAVGKYRSLGWKYKCVDELATLMQNRQDGVYAFFFKWGTTSAAHDFARIFGAAHSFDIPFFFGYPRDSWGYSLTDANRPGFQALQAAMMQYLGNFLRTGNPGTAGGVQWTEWSNTAGGTTHMNLDADNANALIGMSTQRLTIEGLAADAAAHVASWPSGDAALVRNQVAVYTPEYMLNSEGHELLYKNIALSAPLDTTAPASRYSGVNNGAGYQIEIPTGWAAGSSDLVMYAHGYRGETKVLSVSSPSRVRKYLLENGIAWAASSYTANSYNIVSGVESTNDLLTYFKARFGNPRRVYLIGHSMGGHITARTVAGSAYKSYYAGALPMCGVVGGGTDLFSYHLDWGLTGGYFAGLNSSVPYAQDQVDTLVGTVFDGSTLGSIPAHASPLASLYTGATASLNAAGLNFKNAVMYRSGGARPLFDNAFAFWANFMVGNSAARLMDPTGGQQGNIAGNTSTTYSLDGDGNWATTMTEARLNWDIERVSDPGSGFEELMWPVSGDINIPVLTLHTIGDMYVPFSMEQLWAQRIAARGNAALFRARAVRALGHCTFTAAEETRALQDLVAWVEGGAAPGGDDILNPAAVAAGDFGCQYTSEGRKSLTVPLWGPEDPNYDSMCAAD